MNNNKKIFLLVGAFCLVAGFVLAINATKVSAESAILDQLTAAGGTSGANLGTPQDPKTTVVTIIRVLLGFLGVGFLCIVIYAAGLWMFAAGNDDQIGKAKGYLINSIIGLAIILLAYSITTFVFRSVMSLPPQYCTTNDQCGRSGRCNQYGRCVDKFWCETNMDCPGVKCVRDETTKVTSCTGTMVCQSGSCQGTNATGYSKLKW